MFRAAKWLYGLGQRMGHRLGEALGHVIGMIILGALPSHWLDAIHHWLTKRQDKLKVYVRRQTETHVKDGRIVNRSKANGR